MSSCDPTTPEKNTHNLEAKTNTVVVKVDGAFYRIHLTL